MESTRTKALFWESGQHSVTCRLCPLNCKLTEGKSGVCRIKKNVDGKLIATAYGQTTSFNLDPIEKKPLNHFYPGSSILSVGPNSCNLDCSFCQNYQVSQLEAATRFISPEQLAESAKDADNCIGVAYTYSEPLMWYEYIIDTAKKVKNKGLKNVLVTNGYLNEKPFAEILPLIDAFNIDLKSMDESFYKKVCKGKLGPVLRNIELAAKESHLEITNLVIPTLNDSDENFEKLASFIADIDPFIPLHFSRYHADYNMDIGPTPPETLLRAKAIADEKLKYVFIGNINIASDSICPYCKTVLISTQHEPKVYRLKDGYCLECGNKVHIIT